VDRTLAEGISRAALENNASLVILSWRGRQPFTHIFAESIADEVSRRVDCPVAVTAISDSPVEQVYLAISQYDLHPARIDDLQAAISLATTAAPHQPITVGPVNPDQLAEAGITFPEKTEYKPGDLGIIEWVAQTSDKSSLIVTTSRGRAFDRTAIRISELGRSIVSISASKAPSRI
jgi:hypothetical protein